MEKKSGKLDIESVVSAILADYREDRIINRTDILDQPDRDVVIEILGKMIKMIFPGYIREKSYQQTDRHISDTKAGICRRILCGKS